jgi:hypothetical protein
MVLMRMFGSKGCEAKGGWSSARNGNLEVPVYFLKVKQGYTVRKMEIR